MKRFFLIAVLVLALVSSLVAGTMAAYTQELTVDAAGVATKEFQITAKKSSSFTKTNIKIAPGDTVDYAIRVKNESEVPVQVIIDADVQDVGKAAGLANVLTLLTTTDAAGADIDQDNDRITLTLPAGAGEAQFNFRVQWPYSNGDTANETDTALMKAKAQAALTVAINSISLNAGDETAAGAIDTTVGN